MRSKWANKSLKELGVQLIDCVHKTPSAQTHGIPYIGIPQMKNGELDFEASPRLISEADYKLWTEKVNPQRGDIVLSRRCNPGETAYVSGNTKFALGQNLVLLRTTGNLIKSEYLRWVVNSTYWWDEVEKYKNPGAIFDSLKCCDIPNFKIPTPPLHIQDKISYILGSLTDKINLNNKYNHTLEQMSQTLFKSWFVDFDPVIDNALDAGNPIPEALQSRANLRQKVRNSADFKPFPAEIRSLFPSEFEETELGWVPKGWKEGTLPEIAFINSTSWTNKNQPDYINYVDLSNAKDGRIYSIEKLSFNDAPSRARRILKKDDLIFGLVRPANRSFAYVHVDGLTGSTGFAVIRAQKTIYKNFIYYFVTYDKNIEELARIADGGAYPAIKPDDICTLPLIIPSINIIEKFDELTSNFREMMNNSLIQNEYLTNLRGTLLPKLISGELSLEDLPDLTTDTEAA
ncbi:restriction endonuclease subunit S [Escherichia coli]|uniref:restriction endonuclease subunit S n=3 Tax=Escherichia coli TaxID=562 RepID=UPI000B7DAFC2|nr:restriction endonuclease subunit S [Escherichia coli]EHR0266301.1 restriction endonuclease subunit S [Escherichia coli]EHS0472309.1 restriction endonuclease subunit S [Escherichia coli]MDD8348792.1 restriction endonuclease subunit S [Escherichia coli]QMN49164.1 restriction endonuclease subunit S [Escherichia coli]HCX5099250.1 restriction endonuclease subunit S [Escherichia coli]